MSLDKKQIALSIGGILASGGIAYVLYRMQQRDAAANSAAQVEATAAAVTQANAQQYQIATLPQVTVPAITPLAPQSPDTTSAPPAVGGLDPTGLEAIISQFMSQDNSSVTSQQSNHNQLAALPLPTLTPFPTVTIPPLTGGPIESSIPTDTTQAYNNPLRTNTFQSVN